MELKNYFAQDGEGNALPGAHVTLYTGFGGTELATGLKDKSGASMPNPFLAEPNGFIQFAAPNGEYDLRVVSGLQDYRISIRCADVEEQVEAAQTAAGVAQGYKNEAASQAIAAANSAADATLITYGGGFSTTPKPGQVPIARADGTIDPGWLASANNIGVMGDAGFGVGICPNTLPAGMNPLPGYSDVLSANYGNYQYSDGSIMVWIPAFYYKYGTGSNGLTVNVVDIKSYSSFVSVAEAALQGYALHRMFYDGGVVKSGVFVDKYLCSNNSGTASSIKSGNPLSTRSPHNPLSGLTGAPTNAYHGAITAAKTRGAGFFCSSLFINKGLALLALAHASASSNTTHCAWYDATYNFPKGCNNDALGDINDGALSFVSDGYLNACKTGSANVLAKTTHNGQDCGVADLNGCMWEVSPGLTMDSSDPAAGHFYVLKTTTEMKSVTTGTSSATDLWGAAGYAALYDDLGVMNTITAYALNFSDRILSYGNAGQTLSAATSGEAWAMTGAGVPLLVGGTNQFGNDYLGDYSTNQLCPLAGGSWTSAAIAGVWALTFGNSRTNSNYSVGFRAALYL